MLVEKTSYDIEEAANKLGVSTRTIHRYIDKDLLHPEMVKHRYHFKVEEVNALVNRERRKREDSIPELKKRLSIVEKKAAVAEQASDLITRFYEFMEGEKSRFFLKNAR